MCDYLFIGSDLDLGSIRNRAGEHLDIWDGNTPNIRCLNPKIRNWAVVTNGHCSCGVSPITNEEEAMQEEKDKRIRKYKKRGYSKAKIERALAAWERQSSQNVSHSAEATRLILSLLQLTGRITVFSHYFSAKVSEERLPQPGKKRVGADEIRKNPSGWLQSDMMTVVQRGQQWPA